MSVAREDSTSLRLSEDLSLPLDAVTQTFALIGQRGVGKTHTASVLIEEMLEQRQRVTVIDPIGVWWGLRSSADGKSDGYPVVIFGGDHADLPIEPAAGELIANLVVDQHIACVIDLSHMRKGEQRTFMTAFTETLYHRNRDPLHLVVDEADLYAGQRPPKGGERLLGAMEDLVRRGRSRGVGMTLITQRPAVIHKDVLSQTSVLIALRLVSPQDAKALDAWISQHDIANQRLAVLESLPSLPVGAAWVWSPGTYDVFAKVAIRRRRTYDSSATPKVGERRQVPNQYASVDLEALSGKMSDLVDRAKESDPRHLQREVATLRRKLEAAQSASVAKAPRVALAKPEVVERIKIVNVPALDSAIADDLRATVETLRGIASEANSKADAVVAALDEAMATSRRQEVEAARAPATPARRAAPEPRERPQQTVRVPSQTPPPEPAEDSDYAKSRAGAKRIMESLAAFYPDPLTRSQVGALAKMKFKSGTFSTYLGELKRAALVESVGDRLVATALGVETVGVIPPRPTTTEEMYALWQGRLRAGAMRMLDVVLAAPSSTASRQEVADGAELSIASGTFSTYLGELRRFDLLSVNGQDVSLGGVWDLV